MLSITPKELVHLAQRGVPIIVQERSQFEKERTLYYGASKGESMF